MNKEELNSCLNIAYNTRKNILDSVCQKTKYHLGGTFSCVEMIVYIYNILLKNVDLSQTYRDSVILSKGHACLALYSVLCELGYIKNDELFNYAQFGSHFQGHPDMRACEFIDFSSGSLGQGLSVAVGMALANKSLHLKNKVFVILGDGELQEGQVWEAAMSAAHYNLEDLFCFIDRNQLQVDGYTEDVMALEPLDSKWFAFGWDVRVVDGHDFKQIDSAYHQSCKIRKPHAIILNTIKGKGIDFIEGKKEWHSGYLTKENIFNAQQQFSSTFPTSIL